jgi:uncharacterized membrane protein YqaE (UPF0057 family)
MIMLIVADDALVRDVGGIGRDFIINILFLLTST